MLRRVAWIGLVPLAAVSCQGKTASAPPSDDGGVAFTYSPQGCKYSYSPPETLAFQALSLDNDLPVDPNDPPQRVRVGFGGGTTMGQPGYADPTTTAAFTWETNEASEAAKVELGTSPTALTQVQSGYTWSLQPSFGTSLAYFHEVHVCGLQPDTTYYYQVGGGAPGSQVWSATQSFSTLPATGPITVGVFGDARDTVGTWTAVHTRMKAAGILLSLIGGDIVDIGGDQTLYAQWLNAIWQPTPPAFLTLGQQYIVPINGNHENDVPTSFSNWAIPGDGPYAETYASFTVGSVHFVLIDDQEIGEEPTSTEAQAQLQWIAQDLNAANNDRAAHPFIVAIGHRGLFSTSLHSTDADVLAARAALSPLYDQYHVDLVINGHDHEYERTYPITGGANGSAPTVQPQGQGTTYVICAGAGADPYAVGTTSIAYRATKTAYGPNTPYIGAYTLLQIAPTTLTLTAYGMKASASTYQEDDVIDGPLVFAARAQ